MLLSIAYSFFLKNMLFLRIRLFLKITFSQINVVTSLDENEAISIVECEDVLNNFDLKISLSSIASNFLVISSTIKKLEKRGLALTSATL